MTPDDDYPQPHPNLHPALTQQLQESAILGGIKLEDCPVGTTLEVETQNRTYRLVHTPDTWTIEGHPKYCPAPTPCRIAGSSWGGGMLKMGFIGRGMCLEFGTASGGVRTSTIQDVRRV